MKKWEENKAGIADALKAMWDACESGDFDTAAEEFATAQSLADDDSEEMEEKAEGKEEPKKGGLLVALLGKDKKD